MRLFLPHGLRLPWRSRLLPNFRLYELSGKISRCYPPCGHCDSRNFRSLPRFAAILTLSSILFSGSSHIFPRFL
ncbi:hypothetical protein BDV25DRAFT_77495 [Aspergillus avenaceus]|uniref:Uncharacterized protein n=1 Tax=Aspergillus avenaceus TaxID=36643 RepID=A0A5N6TFE5_ASPAV|nr:hypothetical protein BDV25DRAFT_77495 [Aspergillus avenaceus]